MCRFIETICVVDGRPQALAYHRARVRDTVTAVQFSGITPESGAVAEAEAAADCLLQRALKQNTAHSAGRRAKLRVAYRVDSAPAPSAVEIEQATLTPYRLPKIRSLRLVDGGDIEYRLKYSDRSALERLYRRRGRCDDILIVRRGLLTDTFICNVGLYDGFRWQTPAGPLLAGTRRARLIDQGCIEPAAISAAGLGRYTQLALFNAMIDLGELVLPVTAVCE